VSDAHSRHEDEVLRTLRRQILEADDEQVRRVVATVDALAARGAADHVIAPVRLRLGGMQVAHPLRLARLLFLPLDPLIVTPVDWKPGAPTLPRSIIAPMTRLVEAGLGARAGAIRQAIRKHTTADTETVGTVGADAWPEAAGILAAA